MNATPKASLATKVESRLKQMTSKGYSRGIHLLKFQKRLLMTQEHRRSKHSILGDTSEEQ
jgi:hypothetical protein